MNSMHCDMPLQHPAPEYAVVLRYRSLRRNILRRSFHVPQLIHCYRVQTCDAVEQCVFCGFGLRRGGRWEGEEGGGGRRGGWVDRCGCGERCKDLPNHDAECKVDRQDKADAANG